MRDDSGDILYVGKAASLRHRVSSYFASSANLVPKIRTMVSKVADFEFIMTESEQEALILECNLIKEYRPRYNIRLKDDKSFLMLRLDDEPFPRLKFVRAHRPRAERTSGGRSRLFGPFASARAVRPSVPGARPIPRSMRPG